MSDLRLLDAACGALVMAVDRLTTGKTDAKDKAVADECLRVAKFIVARFEALEIRAQMASYEGDNETH